LVIEIKIACQMVSPCDTAIAPKPKLTEKYPMHTGIPAFMPARNSLRFMMLSLFKRIAVLSYSTHLQKSKPKTAIYKEPQKRLLGD
jgi:hypothetical protein